MRVMFGTTLKMENKYSVWIADSGEANDYYFDSMADAIVLAHDLEDDGYDVLIEVLTEDEKHLAWCDSNGNPIE